MKTERKSTVIFASIIAGVFASTASLNQIISQIFSGFQGSIMTLIYIFVTALILIIGLIMQNNRYIKFNKTVFFVAILFLIYYIFTSVFIGTPFTEIHYFLVFTIAAFVVPSIIAVDEIIFMRTVIYLSVLGLPYVNEIFTFDYNNNISMGNSYAFLFPVITSIVYFLHYFKTDRLFFKVFDLLAFVTNAIYFSLMIMFGSRGPIVCILGYITCYVVLQETTTSVIVRKGRFVFFAVIFLILSLNFVPILTYLSRIIESFLGINLNFIDKFIRMSYEGDMTNGRDYITYDTIKGIMDRPILGHGCDLFHLNHDYIYPHNFILQMFYDMGIVISLIFLISLIKKFRSHIKYKYNYNKYTLMMLLFFASVPGALFSADLWNNIVLWFFFGSVFSKTFSYSTNISTINNHTLYE